MRIADIHRRVRSREGGEPADDIDRVLQAAAGLRVRGVTR